jgi:3-dehydroquinate synthase
MLFHTINFSNGTSEIYLENDILNKAGEIIRSQIKGNNAVIVSDSNVAPLYGKTLIQSLEKEGFTVSLAKIKAGEQSKTMNTVLWLYGQFNNAKISRSDVIIALGGGVVGDITGFSAATYLRGVPYFQIPTSLLAQIDSSIGGKTGVDLEFGKNLAGAFYQPKGIITDANVLKTLSPKYLADGLAEAIKYGCIKDSELLEEIENGVSYDKLGNIVKKCILIKSRVVEADEHDLGERMILNFGHTFGHAIEKCLNFDGYSHGEAVAIGMVIAAKISMLLNLISKDDVQRIKNIIKANNLPISTDIPKEKLFEAIMVDKKRLDNAMNFIVLKRVGDGRIYKTSIKELLSLYERACEIE